MAISTYDIKEFKSKLASHVIDVIIIKFVLTLNMVLISKTHRRAVYEDLIGEGVIVVKKDLYLPNHQYITSVPNIVVTIVVRSFKPKKHLNEVFN